MTKQGYQPDSDGAADNPPAGGSAVTAPAVLAGHKVIQAAEMFVAMIDMHPGMLDDNALDDYELLRDAVRVWQERTWKR